MAQHIQSEWDGNVAVHRYEDLALIRSVLRDLAPARVVELGTAEGGFAAFLACTVVEWDGRVLSLDYKSLVDANFNLYRDPACDFHVYDNLELAVADVLAPTRETLELIGRWLSEPHACLYTDNGNKQLELETYVPLMHEVALVGTHDYGTELSAEWAEAFMARHRFRPYRHAEFAALAHPDHYPDSLTRFWVRGLEEA